MSDWWTSLPDTRAQVWARLAAGVADRTAAARHPVLATVGAAGAEARVVVLRGFDPASAVLRVHTDVRSAKVAELAAEPHATLLVWDAAAQFQIRLRVTVAVVTGGAAEADWIRVPAASARLYGGTPGPGAVLAVPEDALPAPDRAMFAVLACTVRSVETLHLGPDRHRRALFAAADGWVGGWRAP